MDSRAESYHGQLQYDPTYNPYQGNSNSQSIQIDSTSEEAARIPSGSEGTAVSSGSSAVRDAGRGKPSNGPSPSSEYAPQDYEEEYENSDLATMPTEQNIASKRTPGGGESAEVLDEVPELEPIRVNQSRPSYNTRSSTQGSRARDQGGLYHSLTRRWTAETKKSQQGGHEDEMQEIRRLLTQMFGKERREHSEEEKTRHVGVVWKGLTVTGAGLGASVQGTLSAPFYGLKALFTKGPKGVKHKTPSRTIVDDFTGCLRPGEMCLVLGRPGSGCSTLLKVLANQRSGYESVEGEVTYGGTEAHTMEKNYASDMIYNPEDDLHYATLKVRDTLGFAIQSRIPGKESREEGETKKQYADKFLEIVSKLFWIGEFTLWFSNSNDADTPFRTHTGYKSWKRIHSWSQWW